MFSTFITVALFVSLAIQGASADFAISTPPLVQCKPVQVSWAATSAPYQLEVVSASDPCGDALDTIGGLHSTVMDYVSSIKSGTHVVFFISDAAGDGAWSGNITIGPSSNNTCIPGYSSINIPSATPTPVVNPTHTTPSASASSSGGELGGAINAGTNPLNSAALSVRQASTPLLLITALAAMFALTL